MFELLFSESGLSLERLRVLIEVHDAGSIARTAPGNEVRHSQYSRQLRELSAFFGCEVTHRRGKVLKLTTEGERLAELARPLLNGLQDFHSQCRNELSAFTIAAGDSLIHWLVIPRVGRLLTTLPKIRFSTSSLRTNEIVRQISDGQVDFGLIRKNAMIPGLKSVTLGMMAYVAVAPTALAHRKAPPTFSEIFTLFPLAMQNTDGQFAKHLRNIALSETSLFRPGLGCESFPQTLAAVRSGQFAAIIPKLSVQELPAGSVHIISDEKLDQLQREIILVWNPRVTKVRPLAQKVAITLQSILKFD